MKLKKLNSIKETVKTPVFVYDVREIKSKLKELKTEFKKVNKKVNIFYSYKTNVSLGKIIYSMGNGIQATSLSHIKEAVKFAKGNRIIYNSRELDETTLNFLIKNKIQIVVNSLEQLESVKKKKSDYPIGIRIDTEIISKNTEFTASKLGLGIPLNQLKNIKGNIIGVHNHLASQNNDIKSYKKNAKILIKLARKLKVEYIDIGGGFPISYERMKAINLKQFAQSYRSWKGKLYIEPGRFLVGSSGYLFVKIIDIANRNVIINTSVFRSLRDRILSNSRIQLPLVEKGDINYKIIGNSACSCDYFGDYKLKKPKIGQILTFTQAGAYCISNDDFTGVTKPREFIYLNKKLRRV